MVASKGNLVGFEYAQAWLTGTDGKAYGTLGKTSAEAAANTPVMPAYLLEFPVSAALPNPQRVVTQLRGGDRNLGQVLFGITEIGSFPLVLSNIDFDFIALAGGSSKDTTTNKAIIMGAANKNRVILPQMGLLLTAIYQTRDAGNDGNNIYIHYLLPRVEIDANYPQMGFQAAGDVTATVTPKFTDMLPHGVPLSATGLNLHRNREYVITLVSDYPLHITTFIGDATTTTITLPYLPVSSSVALPSATGGALNEMRVNGAAVAPASVNTTTGVLTQSAAAADAAFGGLLIHTEFRTAA